MKWLWGKRSRLNLLNCSVGLLTWRIGFGGTLLSIQFSCAGHLEYGWVPFTRKCLKGSQKTFPSLSWYNDCAERSTSMPSFQDHSGSSGSGMYNSGNQKPPILIAGRAKYARRLNRNDHRRYTSSKVVGRLQRL